jgi:hypothetical protein
MKVINKLIRPEEVEFFLLLLDMWEGAIALPPPPRPPFGIESVELLYATEKTDSTKNTESRLPASWTSSEPA